jgi:hypothetical protein
MLRETLVGLVGARSTRQIAKPIDERFVRGGANVFKADFGGRRSVGLICCAR